jgi:hypothetical protein
MKGVCFFIHTKDVIIYSHPTNDCELTLFCKYTYTCMSTETHVINTSNNAIITLGGIVVSMDFLLYVHILWYPGQNLYSKTMLAFRTELSCI